VELARELLDRRTGRGERNEDGAGRPTGYASIREPEPPMTTNTFSQLLGAIAAPSEAGPGEGFTVSPGDNWRQGRTLYGGLSAALSVECATRALADLPPLRSAQFAFMAPPLGELRIVPTLLRRGKSAAFVGVDLHGEAGLAVRSLLCFGMRRASAWSHLQVPAPAAPSPEAVPLSPDYGAAYAFTHNFDVRIVSHERPFASSRAPRILQWWRHGDAAAPDTATSLIALADVPPGAAAVFAEPLPVSTMTWMVELLAEHPLADDGWRLVDVRADTIVDGYSSESIKIWNRAGVPLMVSRQSIAVFA
jgi:acyl-CoA thioesterase